MSYPARAEGLVNMYIVKNIPTYHSRVFHFTPPPLLQGDMLTPYLFIICLDYVLQTSIDLMKEYCFTLAKRRSRQYPTQTIPDADYADYVALLANTPSKVKFLLHNLEKAAGGIGLHVNTEKNRIHVL